MDVSSSAMAKTLLIVVVALVLVSSWPEMLVVGVRAATTCDNTESYKEDAGYAANVGTILSGMRIATANGDVYTAHLTFPDVYGRSTCANGLDVGKCVQCLSDATAEMQAQCPQMKAATTTGTDGLCTAKYSNIDITN